MVIVQQKNANYVMNHVKPAMELLIMIAYLANILNFYHNKTNV